MPTRTTSPGSALALPVLPAMAANQAAPQRPTRERHAPSPADHQLSRAGSIHFTPGRCYDEASNGNESEIHWDLVMIQRPDHGGGEMWFDNELVRKDGRFVVKDLEPLNPENLK